MAKFRQHTASNISVLTSIQSFLIALGLFIWSTQIIIPFYPVPLTLHTFVFGFNALFLKETWKPLIAYILLRFVFPSMTNISLMYSIGYLAGMMIAGIVMSRVLRSNTTVSLLFYPCSMIIIYMVGAGYLALVHGFGFWNGIVPYMILEVVKYVSLLLMHRLHRCEEC